MEAIMTGVLIYVILTTGLHSKSKERNALSTLAVACTVGTATHSFQSTPHMARARSCALERLGGPPLTAVVTTSNADPAGRRSHRHVHEPGTKSGTGHRVRLLAVPVDLLCRPAYWRRARVGLLHPHPPQDLSSALGSLSSVIIPPSPFICTPQ